jgi:hypothetical protein
MNDIISDKYAKIYKGKLFHKSKTKIKNTYKIIAFDLDETLGSFMDLNILWKSIQESKNVVNFNKLLDLYPEFLRYGIMSILEYLYQKKCSGECAKLYVYTNNQCSAEWTNQIVKYFDYKLSAATSIFDQIINAFKINDKKVELMRTTHDKTHSDFIKCTVLPKTTEICFVDNTYFDKMEKDCIYYIQPRSYYHHLSAKEIVDRYVNSPLYLSGNVTEFYDRFLRDINYKYFDNLPKKMEMDVFVAQKIMYHVKEFFLLTTRKCRTRKIKVGFGRNTHKKR